MKKEKHTEPLTKDRFSYTLENCFFAKKELLKKGFKEEDFYLNDHSYSETYFHNEPMIKTNDDFNKSAFELWKETQWNEEDDKNMLDFFMENNLL